MRLFARAHVYTWRVWQRCVCVCGGCGRGACEAIHARVYAKVVVVVATLLVMVVVVVVCTAVHDELDPHQQACPENHHIERPSLGVCTFAEARPQCPPRVHEVRWRCVEREEKKTKRGTHRCRARRR